MAVVGPDLRESRIRRLTIAAGAVLAMSTVAGSCRQGLNLDRNSGAETVLRVGVAQLSATNPLLGLRQLSQNLSLESLARTGENGRMQPWLAETWTLSPDGRLLTVTLRANVKFQNGSPLDASAIARLVPPAMRNFLGPLAEDVERIDTRGNSVEISLHEPSPLFTESLEALIVQPDSGIGTGPFAVVPNSTTEMRSNTDYYLGRVELAGIHVESYPSVRTAWAEMLRDRLDMLYEVGADALASMENSTTISKFTFTRRYQYLISLNAAAPALQSREIRRALSQAIDRTAVVNNALAGYGIASSGPIWPKYWALRNDLPRFEFDPQRAAEGLAQTGRKPMGPRKVRFSCLVPPDAVSERLALEVKRQLEAVGVEMALEAAPQEEIVQRMPKKQYEAALIELISGPTLLRPYLVWRSKSPLNWGDFGNATVDAALERVRHATSGAPYADAVAGLQQAFMDDPPAIFLAWSVRARAVSKRFAVPPAEAGRDVLSTLRLWKPATGDPRASRN